MHQQLLLMVVLAVWCAFRTAVGSTPPHGCWRIRGANRIEVTVSCRVLESPGAMRPRIGDWPAAEDADTYMLAWTVRGA